MQKSIFITKYESQYYLSVLNKSGCQGLHWGLQNVDIMVSTNMHPIILAATSNIPSIALSYHYKVDDYMASLGLDKFLLKIDDFTSNKLSQLIIELIEKRNEIWLRFGSTLLINSR